MAKSKNNNNDLLTEEVTEAAINWFPGHMHKAVKEIKKRLQFVDIVLEIRDARSPLVTGNVSIHQQLGEKSRVIVINKSDLADPETLELWKKWFSHQNIPFIFVSSLDKASLKKVVQLSKKVVHDRRLQSNPNDKPKTEFKMMILGLPNTGKSTIINKLSNRNASKAAPKPGQTQRQLWVKIDQDLEILDTPGIMPPKIEKHEHGLWLSAIHAIPDKIVTAELPACYIIEHFLKKKSDIFKKVYDLKTLEIDLIETLNHIATIRGCIRHKGEFDYERVFHIILNDFRSGVLGKVSFGIPPAIRE